MVAEITEFDEDGTEVQRWSVRERSKFELLEEAWQLLCREAVPLSGSLSALPRYGFDTETEGGQRNSFTWTAGNEVVTEGWMATLSPRAKDLLTRAVAK